MIEISDLAINVGDKSIVSPISFSVEESEKVLLAGDSGAGKSSILKALLGGFPAWKGSISISGEKLTEKSVAKVRKQIAYIPQEPRLGDITVTEFFSELFHYRANKHQTFDETKLLTLLEKLYLPKTVLEQPCSSLSGGERQRIAIIAALLLDTPIILADEITSALDAKSRVAATDLLLLSDKTVISVSHDPHWQSACKRTITVKKGA